MPRATESDRGSEYEVAWEAINRLIRAGGSWSGRERNCAFRQTSPGRFQNMSAASGLDSIQDGRAIAVWDFDRDGDEDLLVKSRTGPQVRILQNRTASEGRSIAILLRGSGQNTAAIGAKVSVRCADKLYIREVRAGSGFLSQNSRRLLIGVGAAAKIDRVEVRWPNGQLSSFANLSVDRSFTVTQKMTGDAAIEEVKFREQVHLDNTSLENTGDRNDLPKSTSRSIALVDELGLRPLPVRLSDGSVDKNVFRADGSWKVVSFWLPDCASCLSELAEWGRSRSKDDALRVVAVAPSAADADLIDRLAERTGLSIGTTDASSLLALGLAFESAFGWRRDFSVPASLLISPKGKVVRAYSGRVAWTTLQSDLRRQDGVSTPTRGLPFAGRYHQNPPRRKWFELGVRYASTGFLESALENYERELRVSPRHVDALYSAADAQLRLGQTRAAKLRFTRLLGFDPKSVDALVGLARALSMERSFEAAMAQLLKARALRPDRADVFVALGQTAAKLGDFSQSLKFLAEARRLDPDGTPALRALSNVFRAQGQLDQAEKYLQQVVRLDAKDASSWSDLAVLLAEQGRLDAALDAAERSVSIDNADFAAWVNLGLILEASELPKRAGAAFEEAVLRSEGNPVAAIQLAQFHARQGRVGAARLVLERLLEQHPSFRPAREMLRLLR